jgi:hypothetical protein
MIDTARALRLAKEAYNGSTSYFDTNVRPQVERNLRAFQSRHAADSKYMSQSYATRSRLYRPKTRTLTRQNEALAAEAFFSTADVVRVTPEDESDPPQQQHAELMQALVNYRLQKTIPWFLTLIGAYQDAMTVGVVISIQEWLYDASKKVDRPNIELIPIENFRFDPAASWTDPVGTSPYLVRLIPMYVKDVKRRMRTGVDGKVKWVPMRDEHIATAVQMQDSTRMLREDNRMDSRGKVTGINDYTIVWVHQNIIEVDGVDLLYYTLGTNYLLSEPEPLESEFWHGKRPFVVGYAVIETHKPYPSSPTQLVSGLAQEINEIANQRIDNVKFAMNKRYFAKRNRQVDIASLRRNSPGSITMMTDPDGDVRVVDTPDVTASSYQEQDRLNADFDDLGGNFSASTVQTNRSLNETVGGLELLDQNINAVSRYQLKTFVETWVAPVLHQLVLLEQEYETDEKVIGIACKKSEFFRKEGLSPTLDMILENELSLGISISGTESPAQRVSTLTTALRGLKEALGDGILAGLGVDSTEVIQEVLGALGHKDGGVFLKNEEDISPAERALQQQVQELQAELEKKYPQVLLDAMVKKTQAETEKIKAEKVAVGNTAAYSALQTAEVIAAVPGVAPIADKIMQSSGYTVPTPPGIDPEFPNTAQQADPSYAAPAPGGSGPGLSAAAEAVPPGLAQQVAPEQDTNTSPMFPPRSDAPGTGVQGIETQRPDGANGGGVA